MKRLLITLIAFLVAYAGISSAHGPTRKKVVITRDIAAAFNRQYGEVLVVPEARIDAQVMIVPGTDGRKMSKSYDNVLNVFLPEKELKKQVMSIVTDSAPLEEPKDPDKDHVFALFKLLASEADTATMRDNYERGGYGYGHAKKELLGLLLDTFAQERQLFQELMEDRDLLEERLRVGAEKARTVAQATLRRVRQAGGYA